MVLMFRCIVCKTVDFPTCFEVSHKQFSLREHLKNMQLWILHWTGTKTWVTWDATLLQPKLGSYHKKRKKREKKKKEGPYLRYFTFSFHRGFPRWWVLPSFNLVPGFARCWGRNRFTGITGWHKTQSLVGRVLRRNLFWKFTHLEIDRGDSR